MQPASIITSWCAAIRNLVLRWARAQIAFQDLLRLDDRALKDIGLTRGDVYRTATMLADTKPAATSPAPADTSDAPSPSAIRWR
jgi:uncharacterized protein YjiS (DUF1127 family)